jgi:hypothetical protein
MMEVVSVWCWNMQTKFLLAPVILLALVCAPIAFADEIVVVDADNVWNLTLDDATDVDRLVGEPDVMVVKYADMFSYKSLENATEIERLVGEPGVMVVRYADIIAYKPLENATEVETAMDASPPQMPQSRSGLQPAAAGTRMLMSAATAASPRSMRS